MAQGYAGRYPSVDLTEGTLAEADESRYREIQKAALLEIKESALAGSIRAMGSDANMDIGMINGDVPVRNWAVGEDFELSAAPSLDEVGERLYAT